MSKLLVVNIPSAVIEFVFDTARAVASLMFTGCLERFTDVSFILSHGGGAVPALAWRLAIGLEAEQMTPQERAKHTGEFMIHPDHWDVLDEGKRGLELLRTRFYYDTALSATPFALAALQALVGPDRILFGSDIPYAPEFIVAETVKGLTTYAKFEDAGHQAVARDNALRLFSRLAGRIDC